jgi:hypothetical protein
VAVAVSIAGCSATECAGVSIRIIIGLPVICVNFPRTETDAFRPFEQLREQTGFYVAWC